MSQTCSKCQLPLPPRRRFLCARDAAHAFHDASGVCRALARLRHGNVTEGPPPVTALGRLVEGISPRTASTLRHVVTEAVLQHNPPPATLFFAVCALDNASAEQTLLASLAPDVQLSLAPFLQQRLDDAGISLATGSIVVRGGTPGDLHLSQAIDRAQEAKRRGPSLRHSPPWSFASPRTSGSDHDSSPRVLSRDSGRLPGRNPAAATPLRLSSTFWTMRHMTVLDVAGMPLASLPPAVTRYMLLLTSLTATGCGLAQLPGDIDRLALLTELNGADNQLTMLPDGIGRLSRLSLLDCSRNVLTALPASIVAGLLSLTTLRVSGNLLRALPDTALAGLPVLRHIDSSGNQLDDSPRALATAPALQFLNLSNNKNKLPACEELDRARQRIIITC